MEAIAAVRLHCETWVVTDWFAAAKLVVTALVAARQRVVGAATSSKNSAAAANALLRAARSVSDAMFVVERMQESMGRWTTASGRTFARQRAATSE